MLHAFIDQSTFLLILLKTDTKQIQILFKLFSAEAKVSNNETLFAESNIKSFFERSFACSTLQINTLEPHVALRRACL